MMMNERRLRIKMMNEWAEDGLTALLASEPGLFYPSVRKKSWNLEFYPFPSLAEWDGAIRRCRGWARAHDCLNSTWSGPLHCDDINLLGFIHVYPFHSSFLESSIRIRLYLFVRWPLIFTLTSRLVGERGMEMLTKTIIHRMSAGTTGLSKPDKFVKNDSAHSSFLSIFR